MGKVSLEEFLEESLKVFKKKSLEYYEKNFPKIYFPVLFLKRFIEESEKKFLRNLKNSRVKVSRGVL